MPWARRTTRARLPSLKRVQGGAVRDAADLQLGTVMRISIENPGRAVEVRPRLALWALWPQDLPSASAASLGAALEAGVASDALRPSSPLAWAAQP